MPPTPHSIGPSHEAFETAPSVRMKDCWLGAAALFDRTTHHQKPIFSHRLMLVVQRDRVIVQMDDVFRREPMYGVAVFRRAARRNAAGDLPSCGRPSIIVGMKGRSARTDQLWSKFRHDEGLASERYLVTHFRLTSERAGEALARIFAGATRALVAPVHFFGHHREEPLPQTGDYTVLVDHGSRPRVIWRTTGVKVASLSDVENTFVWQSGLNSGYRPEWLQLRREEFRRLGKEFGFPTDDEQALFENIEVVWPHEVASQIRRLTPFLDRGVALVNRLERQDASLVVLDGIMAQLQTAVVVVNRELQVRYTNPPADLILRRGDGIIVEYGRLRAYSRIDHDALLSLVRSACVAVGNASSARRPHTKSQGVNAIISIARRDQGRPYRATILPLWRYRVDLRHDPTAILFLIDPDEAGEFAPPADVYGRFFSLTPAEARLAVHLASGMSLVEAARELRVRHTTARTQLSAIFDKTDARRQTDLVRLLHECRSLKIMI